MNVSVYRRSGGDRAAGNGKSALCLCGGGITGALFEAGVLAALDDLMGRPVSTEFDIYVGSSAGASVGSVISQGVPAERIFRALGDPSDPFFPLRREDVYRLELKAWAKATWRLLRAGVTILIEHLSKHEDRLVEDLGALKDLLPAGFFRLERYVEFLRTFYEREALSQQFSALSRELYVVANDVDAAERVVFGDGALRDVDLAMAVAASSAIPMFFEPVRIGDRDYIDGGVGRVAHVDVAIEHGAHQIVVINPLVPVRNVSGNACLPSRNGPCAQMREKGMLYILNQAWRITNRTRLHFGIKRYMAEHPQVEVLLVEPSNDETLLFVNSTMGLRARRQILDYARAEARKALAEAFSGGLQLTGIAAQAIGPGPKSSNQTEGTS